LLIWGTIFCAQEYRATKHYQRSYEFKISCLKSLHHWLKINFMDEKIIEKITELTWEKIITPPGSAYKKNEPPTLNNFTHSK
jgi:hypothetical protein